MDPSEATFNEELYLISPPPTVVIGGRWKELQEKEVELLSKILHSVKLSLASVRVIEQAELDMASWKEKPSKIIGFGTRTEMPSYEVVTTPGTQLVLADSLSILSDNDELKKKLWISLKQLFFQ